MNHSLINDATALLVPAKNFESPDRRTWLKTTLGIGYASACVPLFAQTSIRTSSEGLLCGEAMVNVNGFQMPVYRSVPLGQTNCPVVLVVSEIFGVHEYIADITKRLAQQGYMEIAPELMLRQGDPSSYAEIGKLMVEVISKVPDEQVMDDLDACVVWAASQGGNVSKLGITGFCWGGRITWLYAAHNPKVRAGVAWYGRLNGPVSALNPRHAIDLVGQLKAPVLGLYGGADTGIPMDAVEKMQTALISGSDAARRSLIHVYANAPHAFHADYRPSYRDAEAKDGWQRMLKWFDLMK
ncbi:MAG: dienelactone hydrolase family protein [Limnohabitans sp.]